MYKIPAVIFAGGKSSRMGKDKALLPFKTFSTLSEFQYTKLKQFFNTVYLSSKEDKFNFKCDIVYDIEEVSSPLVALLSIFETLETESIFVLSVDTPLIDNTIFQPLLNMHNTTVDATIAKSPHGLEPLCGIYNRSIIPIIQQALEKDMHKLQNVLSTANIQTVNFQENRPFTNLNYMHEYQNLTS